MGLRAPAVRSVVGGVAVAVALSSAACAPPPAPPTPPVIDRFAADATGFTAPALVPLGWTVRDVNGDVLTCRIDIDTDGTWDDTISPCPATGARNYSLDEGTHVATLEVSDGGQPPVTATHTVTVGPGPTESFHIVAQLTTAPDPRVTAAIDEAVARWKAVLARGVPDAAVQRPAGTCGEGSPAFDGVVDDLVVNVAVVPLSGYAGIGGACILGSDGLPRLSFIHLDSAGIDWFHDNGYLGDLVAHELGHALGFTGQKWWDYRVDAGADGFRFTGPRTVAEYSALGGSGTVPLSNGTDHWSELVLQSELMTCYIENGTGHPLSTLTVASMADIGFHVAIEAAEPYELPGEGLLSC